MRKIDLILHPVRFRILQNLSVEDRTTQEIAARMADVPTSSIYRHLKTLLEADLIAVKETRLVNGIQEKTYQLAMAPRLAQEDMEGLSADDHLRYFTVNMMSILRDFDDYLRAAEGDGIDLLADRVGYTSAVFHATLEEMDALHADLNVAFRKLADNKPGAGRAARKMAFINHPIKT